MLENNTPKFYIFLPGIVERGVVTSFDGVRSCRFLLNKYIEIQK